MENAREPHVDPSALFRAIVRSADDAITSIDLHETITSWNRAAERLYGYAASEVLGRSNRLIVPPERYQEEDDVIRRVKSGEGVQHFDTVRVRKDGVHIEVAISASAIHLGDTVVGVSKIAHDISERRTAERNAARLAAIVESSDDAIVAKDLNGIIISWNQAAERMFGYAAHEAIGQSIRMIIPDTLQSEEDTILFRIRRGESIQHFETIRRRKDGSSLPISVTVSPIRNRAGTVIGASKIARDISERRRAEALAARAQREAAFVAQMSGLLSGSLDYEARLKDLVALAVPAVADWAALDTIDPEGRMRRIAVSGATGAAPRKRREPAARRGPDHAVQCETGDPDG